MNRFKSNNLVYWFIILITLWWVGTSIYDQLTHRVVSQKLVTPRGDLAAEEQSTISVFNITSPSVVYITTIKRVSNPWLKNTFRVPSGTGSGFIWDDKGHIITNYHVVRDASAARIRLNDNREYSADLIGASPDHDIAVLRINVNFELPPDVSIGSSKDLQVGQKVFAIGNPFGLDYTLTSGIISALDRSISNDNGGSIDHLIQTDAAINPGNSGGPLIDSSGRVIGVTTAIYSPSGASAGIGFAVPIDTVNRVVPQLIADGEYTPLKLGIQADSNINSYVKQRYNVTGIVVLQVEPSSIADELGLEPSFYDENTGFKLGDVIISVNGHETLTVAALKDALDTIAEHEVLELVVVRNGNTETLNYVISERAAAND